MDTKKLSEVHALMESADNSILNGIKEEDNDYFVTASEQLGKAKTALFALCESIAAKDYDNTVVDGPPEPDPKDPLSIARTVMSACNISADRVISELGTRMNSGVKLHSPTFPTAKEIADKVDETVGQFYLSEDEIEQIRLVCADAVRDNVPEQSLVPLLAGLTWGLLAICAVWLASTGKLSELLAVLRN